MDGHHVTLYLHLLSSFVMAGGITIVGVCYFRLRAAVSVIDAAPWAKLADQAGWVFPPAILGLLATGAYLTSDTWKWSTPWIGASIAGLALITLQGPLVAGPRARALKHALDESGPGPLDMDTRRLTRDRMLWMIIFANPGIVLGITWNMTLKPGLAGAVAAVLVGYAVGAAAALPLTRHPAASTSQRS
jgi:Predicted integral membrane protein (DUF2269)